MKGQSSKKWYNKTPRIFLPLELLQPCPENLFFYFPRQLVRYNHLAVPCQSFFSQSSTTVSKSAPFASRTSRHRILSVRCRVSITKTHARSRACATDPASYECARSLARNSSHSSHCSVRVLNLGLCVSVKWIKHSSISNLDRTVLCFVFRKCLKIVCCSCNGAKKKQNERVRWETRKTKR